MRHGDEEQGDSTQDEQGEGSTSAGKGPGIVVFNPDGLITVNHTLDGLAHYLDRDDDAKACMPKQKECVAGVFTHINGKSFCHSSTFKLLDCQLYLSF